MEGGQDLGCCDKMATHTGNKRLSSIPHACRPYYSRGHTALHARVVNLTAADKYTGRTSEGVEWCRASSDPSSVCTHCLSGSCDQHSGHKEGGTLLNSPGQGLLGEVTRIQEKN